MIGVATIVVEQDCDNCGWHCYNCFFATIVVGVATIDHITPCQWFVLKRKQYYCWSLLAALKNQSMPLQRSSSESRWVYTQMYNKIAQFDNRAKQREHSLLDRNLANLSRRVVKFLSANFVAAIWLKPSKLRDRIHNRIQINIFHTRIPSNSVFHYKKVIMIRTIA